MRLLFAALILVTTLSAAITAAIADEKVDPSYYTDRVMTSSGYFPAGQPARAAGDIYQELHQDNMGQ